MYLAIQVSPFLEYVCLKEIVKALSIKILFWEYKSEADYVYVSENICNLPWGKMLLTTSLKISKKNLFNLFGMLIIIELAVKVK